MLMALHEITNYTRACVFCIHYNVSWGGGETGYIVCTYFWGLRRATQMLKRSEEELEIKGERPPGWDCKS